MKRIGLTLLTIATLVACNSNPKKTDTAATPDKPVADAGPSSNPDYAPGLELTSATDCATCHKPYEVLTGPSYQDIANKYAAEAPGIIPKLAEKIINGGSGVWGQIPMLAHPTVTQADAETMVKYILTFKK
ncbi:MAG: cytochrome c class I [Chitinophagaceae bacterium]|nr:MAG: cytochrome c class I [Chitinophagaceae bacterium]